MCACYQFPTYQDIYGTLKSVPSNLEKNFNTEIKLEGLYIYGGRYEPGLVSDVLYVVQTGQKPWKIVEPETLGRKPAGRWGHAMVYNREENFILIYGGRNNAMFPFVGKTVMDDVWILRLNYMVWCQVDFFNNSIEARYLFASGVYESRLYIVGGMNDDSYIGGKIITLEMNEELGTFL